MPLSIKVSIKGSLIMLSLTALCFLLLKRSRSFFSYISLGAHIKASEWFLFHDMTPWLSVTAVELPARCCTGCWLARPDQSVKSNADVKLDGKIFLLVYHFQLSPTEWWQCSCHLYNLNDRREAKNQAQRSVLPMNNLYFSYLGEESFIYSRCCFGVQGLFQCHTSQSSHTWAERLLLSHPERQNLLCWGWIL